MPLSSLELLKQTLRSACGEDEELQHITEPEIDTLVDILRTEQFADTRKDALTALNRKLDQIVERLKEQS